MPTDTLPVETDQQVVEPAVAEVAQDNPEAEKPAEVVDPYAAIEGLDPEELIRRNTKLQGKVGALAQKQAQNEARRLAGDLFKQWQEESRISAEAQRLEQLAEQDDLLALGEIAKKQVLAGKTTAAMQAQAAQIESSVWRNSVDPVLLSMLDDLPEVAQVTIRGKYDRGEYGTDPIEARRSYFKDVRDNHTRAILAAAKKDWTEKELPALLKEKLGETVGGEESPSSGGGAPVRGQMSQDEFDGHRGDTDWLYQPDNWKRFEAGRKSGIIVRDWS